MPSLNTTIGVNSGFTGTAITHGFYKKISIPDFLSGDIHLSTYFPSIQSQAELKIARYLSGSPGVRVDFTRHFGERAIGGYITISDNQPNFGFHFAIPLNPKRYLSKGDFSLRLSDYFDWNYSWLSFTRYPDYGRYYETQPDENRSAHYWEPGFIKSSIWHMTDGEKNNF